MGLSALSWRGSRHMMLMLVIKLVLWFGWFCSIAFAQLEISESVSGYVNFPIACIGNIAAFITCLIRGRLDLENGAREALGTLRRPKLQKINWNNGNEIGLRTRATSTSIEGGGVEAASVVMLSNGKPNCSMKQFMKSNAVDDVHSILLQYHPFNTVNESSSCNCIKLKRVEEITRQMPERALNRLLEEIITMPDNESLLPCRHCLTNGSHPFNREGLRESVVPDMLDFVNVKSFSPEEAICICIPLNDARHDIWTKRLVSSLSSKDEESRGAVTASKALEEYVEALLAVGGKFFTFKETLRISVHVFRPCFPSV